MTDTITPPPVYDIPIPSVSQRATSLAKRIDRMTVGTHVIIIDKPAEKSGIWKVEVITPIHERTITVEFSVPVQVEKIDLPKKESKE